MSTNGAIPSRRAEVEDLILSEDPSAARKDQLLFYVALAFISTNVNATC